MRVPIVEYPQIVRQNLPYFRQVFANRNFDNLSRPLANRNLQHWYLSFVAYSLLGDLGHLGRSRWAVRGQFQSTGQRCQAVVDALLGHLVHWIAQHLHQGETRDNLIKALLA